MVYEAMTLNERLYAASLLERYEEAVKSNDLKLINKILAQVGMQQDKIGMNRTIDNYNVKN